MPFQITKKLLKTGGKGMSRMIILPKGWWKSFKPSLKNVKLVADKAIIMRPEHMSDSELLECVMFILKQTQSKGQIIETFERVFDIKIVEENSESSQSD